MVEVSGIVSEKFVGFVGAEGGMNDGKKEEALRKKRRDFLKKFYLIFRFGLNFSRHFSLSRLAHLPAFAVFREAVLLTTNTSLLTEPVSG